MHCIRLDKGARAERAGQKPRDQAISVDRNQSHPAVPTSMAAIKAMFRMSFIRRQIRIPAGPYQTRAFALTGEAIRQIFRADVMMHARQSRSSAMKHFAWIEVVGGPQRERRKNGKRCPKQRPPRRGVRSHEDGSFRAGAVLAERRVALAGLPSVDFVRDSLVNETKRPLEGGLSVA